MNARHVNLTQNAVTRAAFTASKDVNILEIISRKGTTEIFFVAAVGTSTQGDSMADPMPDPAANANDTYMLPANVTSPASVRRLRFNGGNLVVVKFFTTGASEQVTVLALARGEDAGTW